MLLEHRAAVTCGAAFVASDLARTLAATDMNSFCGALID
jgi:hypothetical protein